MRFKVGDKVMLKPSKKEEFSKYNENWKFKGIAIGEIVEVRKNEYSIHFPKYELLCWSTHSLPESYLIDPDIINTPLFKLIEETEDEL